MRKSQLICLLLLSAIASTLIGCGGGDEGPRRYHLSGSVTFNGQPVPAGTIYFDPDEVEGNKGPQGVAQIYDGKYDTKDGGKGTVGGPHWIRVDGFDGQKTEASPLGVPLFVPHTSSVNLPKSDSTQDLEVPATAAEGLTISVDPV